MAKEMGKNEYNLRNVVKGSHKSSHWEVDEGGWNTTLISLEKGSIDLEAQMEEALGHKA
jgi:hypothetical protein